MPITKRTPIGDVVSDFEKSKAPQFKGKSKAKRREMAIAAALSKRDGKKMTKEELKKLVKEIFNEVTYVGVAAIDDMAKDPKFAAVKDKTTPVNTLKKGGAVELGEISLIRLQLDERHNQAKTFLDSLVKKEQDFNQSVINTYGKSTINPETGEIIPLT